MKKNTRKGFLFQVKSVTYCDKRRIKNVSEPIDYLQYPLYLDTRKRVLIFVTVSFAIKLILKSDLIT